MTRSSRWVVLAPLTAVVFAFVAAGGCSEQEPPPPPPRYEVLPLREVPPYFEGTILQYVDVMNTEPYPISSYGLVVGLAGTGDNSNIPARVREYMLDEMFRRGFGSSVMGQRYARMKPEMVLADPGAAVVIVTAYVPPGARKGDRLDLFVNALPDSNTSSLAQGILYQTDLRIQGANPLDPRGQVNVYAYGEGRVFVNPVRAVEGPASGMGLASLRSGVVIGGGRALVDRPLMLRLRQPQRVMARAIEARIRLAFPNNLNDEPKPAALAQDEALVELYRPLKFRGDWNHYAKVATHLFLNGSREFSSAKAKVLADVAVEPGAPLESLSYCFEGLGPAAIPHIQPLYAHVSPHVAYWSARAGAMIGDSAAIHALVQVARTENHPHQMAAVRALGVLPPSAMATRVLNELLDVPNASVRIEAYRILRSQEEEPTRVDSLKVSNSFTLDIIPSPGPPLIYAARAGDPRFASGALRRVAPHRDFQPAQRGAAQRADRVFGLVHCVAHKPAGVDHRQIRALGVRAHREPGLRQRAQHDLAIHQVLGAAQGHQVRHRPPPRFCSALTPLSAHGVYCGT